MGGAEPSDFRTAKLLRESELDPLRSERVLETPLKTLPNVSLIQTCRLSLLNTLAVLWRPASFTSGGGGGSSPAELVERNGSRRESEGVEDKRRWLLMQLREVMHSSAFLCLLPLVCRPQTSRVEGDSLGTISSPAWSQHQSHHPGATPPFSVRSVPKITAPVKTTDVPIRDLLVVRRYPVLIRYLGVFF